MGSTKRRRCRVRSDTTQTVADVVARYARKCGSGWILRCMPSRAEIRKLAPRRSHPSNDGKIVYPDLETAQLAAAALWLITGGPRPRAYACERSSSGHAHVTTKPPRAVVDSGRP